MPRLVHRPSKGVSKPISTILQSWPSIARHIAATQGCAQRSAKPPKVCGWISTYQRRGPRPTAPPGRWIASQNPVNISSRMRSVQSREKAPFSPTIPSRVEMQQHYKREQHVGAKAVELAMGEIHHPHDAEDERQADAEQRVNAAEHELVYAMLEEFVHAGVTRNCSLIGGHSWPEETYPSREQRQCCIKSHSPTLETRQATQAGRCGLTTHAIHVNVHVNVHVRLNRGGRTGWRRWRKSRNRCRCPSKPYPP
jgi:hypothetical protein